MASNKSFNIYIEPSMIGCKLSLNISKSKTYVSWSVEDSFNGLSNQVSVNEDIYGFYELGSIVDLYLYDNKGKETVIKNVTLLQKKEVSLDV